MKDMLTRLKEANEFITGLKERERFVNTRQKQVESLIIDIEHELELDNMRRGVMGVKMKELRMALKLRRKYKDEGIQLYKAITSIEKDGMTKAIQEVTHYQQKMETRCYTNRIGEELRAELLGEM